MGFSLDKWSIENEKVGQDSLDQAFMGLDEALSAIALSLDVEKNVLAKADLE